MCVCVRVCWVENIARTLYLSTTLPRRMFPQHILRIRRMCRRNAKLMWWKLAGALLLVPQFKLGKLLLRIGRAPPFLIDETSCHIHCLTALVQLRFVRLELLPKTWQRLATLSENQLQFVACQQKFSDDFKLMTAHKKPAKYRYPLFVIKICNAKCKLNGKLQMQCCAVP